ncbi:MAG: hypothetical protein MI861_19370, partial [Pirellulales bacterium]|nr:hypothetical protein [Pirellulales bacterium]
MTLLGKSFSVVILILSLTFMVLSLAVNASHRNWRDLVFEGVNGQPGLKEQIETMDQTNTRLRDSEAKLRADLVREQTGRATALSALQTELSQVKELLSQSQQLV